MLRFWLLSICVDMNLTTWRKWCVCGFVWAVEPSESALWAANITTFDRRTMHAIHACDDDDVCIPPTEPNNVSPPRARMFRVPRCMSRRMRTRCTHTHTLAHSEAVLIVFWTRDVVLSVFVRFGTRFAAVLLLLLLLLLRPHSLHAVRRTISPRLIMLNVVLGPASTGTCVERGLRGVEPPEIGLHQQNPPGQRDRHLQHDAYAGCNVVLNSFSDKFNLEKSCLNRAVFLYIWNDGPYVIPSRTKSCQ